MSHIRLLRDIIQRLGLRDDTIYISVQVERWSNYINLFVWSLSVQVLTTVIKEQE